MNSNPFIAKKRTMEIKNALALPLAKLETNITISEKTKSGINVDTYAIIILIRLDKENSLNSEITIAVSMVNNKKTPINVAQANTFDR